MLSLLVSRRFLPLFVTQFLGAFNDNLFKNALVILVTYRAATHAPATGQLVNLAFGLFILPFFLFSYLAGPAADAFDRARIARWVKLAEILLALLGGTAIALDNVPMLLLVLFGFGTHSAFFGPVKYALLPQHLRANELLAGNGWVEAGTFIAILAGTIFGGVLVLPANGPTILFVAMTATALAGYAAARRIPAAPAPAPGMKIRLDPWRGTRDLIGHSLRRREECVAILGISWFWLVGSVFLAQFASYAHDTLRAASGVVTLFLVVFSVGIAAGSLLCTRLRKTKGGTAYVPLGAWGISVFTVDLYFATFHFPSAAPLMPLGDFLHRLAGLHIVIDLFAIAVAGGTYIVPLYVMLQTRAEARHVARTIAANNVINALFMVAGAVGAMLVLKAGLAVPQIFLALAALNAGVALAARRF